MKTADRTQVGAAEDQRLAELVEEIAKRLQSGEPGDVDEYIARYPEYADRLRDWVNAMTAMADLGHSLIGDGGPSRGAPDMRSPVTGVLGDFRILRELGRGGMGVVYEAEQISLGRRVALKVLPFAAMLDKQQLARFKNEARAAATLDHPNIVAIHSVGTERGVHYYAMQLVEGESLAQVIARLRMESGARGQESGVRDQESVARIVPPPSPRRGAEHRARATQRRPSAGGTGREAMGRGEGDALTIAHPSSSIQHPPSDTQPVAALSTRPDANPREYFRTIARLGIQAAEALDHAHQNGILHRDVKPANLMVDDDGKLWVMDFGLARIEQDAGMTMTGDLLGTVRYMCPEQALGKRVVVDHRSDVYSLGVTLYELLTLRPAFGGDDRHEILRRIAFEEPRALRQVNRRIPPALETIVLKAMRKSPEQRYATAKELAEDLQRFLANESIRAKPPTFRERIANWSRRHPAVAWAATLALTATAIVSIVSAMLVARAYQREADQRTKAEISAARAEKVSAFLVNTLRRPSPFNDGRSVSLLDALNRSVKDLETQFSDDPETKATLLAALGVSYAELGLYTEAIPLLEQSRELRAAVLGPRHQKTLWSMTGLGEAYRGSGQTEKAIEVHEETLRLVRTTKGIDDYTTQNAMSNLAIDYSHAEKNDDAVRLFEELLRMQEHRYGPKHINTHVAQTNLGCAYLNAGRLKEALPLLEAAYERNKSIHTATHPNRLVGMYFLAKAYHGVGRLDEAIAMHEDALQLRQQALGLDHPDTITSMMALGDAYLDGGRTDDALNLYEEALRTSIGRFGAAHDLSLEIKNDLISAYRAIGRSDDAERVVRDASATRSELSPEH